MEWTFMLIVLWLTTGLPEPHTAAFPQNIDCDSDMAKDVWAHYVSEHADGEVTLDFAWSCEHAKKPSADAPELPPGHPDISKPEPPRVPGKDEASIDSRPKV